MNAVEDLAQIRTLYGRLCLHQALALDAVAAADALVDGLYRTGIDPCALMAEYRAARKRLEDAATERTIGADML